MREDSPMSMTDPYPEFEIDLEHLRAHWQANDPEPESDWDSSSWAGDPHKPCDCPIATYILTRPQYHGRTIVWVDCNFITVLDVGKGLLPGQTIEQAKVRYRTPAVIGRFVE